MAETITGNDNIAEFMNVSQDETYETANDGGQQLYLDSVLPQAYDPNLQPFDTRGIAPRTGYMAVDGYYLNPLQGGNQYTYDNSDKYFFPEHLEQVL
tara:strand:+ start:626 stop:916 length:291 start_codon:yes stop_codon:yes gene_type:complete